MWSSVYQRIKRQRRRPLVFQVSAETWEIMPRHKKQGNSGMKKEERTNDEIVVLLSNKRGSAEKEEARVLLRSLLRQVAGPQ